MLYKYQQKGSKYCVYCMRKKMKKKNCDPLAKLALPASTREWSGASYAGWNFFAGWKYQPTLQKIAGYASYPSKSDLFCHLYVLMCIKLTSTNILNKKKILNNMSFVVIYMTSLLALVPCIRMRINFIDTSNELNLQEYNILHDFTKNLLGLHIIYLEKMIVVFYLINENIFN